MELKTRAITGLGVGSFVYLLLLIPYKETIVHSTSIIFVFLISIFAGLTSIIFDIAPFNFIFCLITHYILINIAAILGSYFLLGFDHLPGLLISILVIYCISYVVSCIKIAETAKNLNEIINNFNQNVNDDN